MFDNEKPEKLSAIEVARAWQDFRKWCVEKAVEAKADDIIATAKLIAAYVITKDELEQTK
jgi:hypothetical protein